jgi:hypothetical protein
VNANETATGEIRLMDMTGKLVFRKSLTVSKGFNTLSADGLKSIGNGMYIAQLIIGGAVIDNQKIVKGN